MNKTVEFFGKVFGSESVATFEEMLGTLSFEQIKLLKEAVAEDYKVAKEENTKAEKDAKDVAKAEKASLAKEYIGTLSVGDEVRYTMADGSIKFGTLGEIKDGAKTCHILLDEQFVEAGKKNDRYVAYDKIIVPAEYSEKEVA